jgi:hypothetical protein
MYDDYAINERLFHWQTQSRVAEKSETAQFIFLGTADYVSHSGNKPMSFVWGLREEMPTYLVPRPNKGIV